ncbi:MAG: hypothetical protein JWQ83_1926, partial [Lacunisphaera sp.]|nr:hypothetical protein [Lacunisphaera sp.]
RVAQARSLALETEAIAARQAGQGDAALEKMREALRLQREANANAGGGGRRDLPREKRLAEEIQSAEAAPGREAVTAALAQARAAGTQEKWGEALKAYTEAHRAQTELNRRFLGTRHADIPGLARIEQELQSLRAAGLAASVTARIQEADEAARTGRAQDAAAGYVAAMAALRELKEKFPQSHFASDPRGDDLEVRRQTVLSEALLTQAVAIDREVREGLRRRQTGAASRLAAAARLVETVVAEYPRSRLLDPALQRRLSYLALKTGELDALQDQIVTRLAPLPGADVLRLLTTEMPQDLYQRVMNGNPSRQAGRGLPVDSVSWQDARECCERLSWLLGRRVRLPTEAEFRAVWAAGGKGAWSADNSAGRSRETGKSPATPAGFYDLAGNLAEWLQAKSEEGETAPVAGGSYLDPAAALTTLKVEAVDRRERAPHIGFRVVVE